MKQTVFEQMNGTYTQQGDYLIPCLMLHDEEKVEISLWGQRNLSYLKQSHKVLYYNLLTSGKLNSHIAEIDKQANDMFFQLVKEVAEKENITEELKSNDQMLWLQKMNYIRNRVTEIVNKEIIYA